MSLFHDLYLKVKNIKTGLNINIMKTEAQIQAKIKEIKDECVYPDWEGGYIYGKHRYDKDGYCVICGHSIF